MKFLKLIYKLFHIKNKVTEDANQKNMESNSFSLEESQVEELISNLSFNSTNQNFQKQRRIESFEKLGDLGIVAVKAIPALIEKRFSIYEWERKLSKESIIKIDINWPLNGYTQSMVGYLIKKLIQETSDEVVASEILSLIGDKANLNIIEKLLNENDENKQSTYLKYLTKVSKSDLRLLQKLNTIFSESKNSVLLKMSLNYLKLFKDIDNKMTFHIGSLLKHNDTNVKIAAIKLLNNIAIESSQVIVENDNAIIEIINSLSSDSEIILQSSIELLSKIDDELLEMYYITVLQSTSEINENNQKDLFKKFIHNIHEGETGHMVLRKDRYLNNIFWFNLEFDKFKNKSFKLLDSILKILEKKQHYFNLDKIIVLIITILKLFEGKPKEFEIIENLIKILGKADKNKNEIVDELLNWLSHKNINVIKATILSLDKIDINWLTTKDTFPIINKMINNLDGNNELVFKAALLELDIRIIPSLIQGLRNPKGRLVKILIIDLLESFISIKYNLIPISLLNEIVDGLIKLNIEMSNLQISDKINNLMVILKNDLIRGTNPKEDKEYDQRLHIWSKIDKLNFKSFPIKKSESFIYDVAFSFASENKEYVEKIAKNLRDNGISVFDYIFKEAEVWGQNINLYLDDIYGKKAKLCVVFISDHYKTKFWTQLEWSVILSRAIENNQKYLLPVRLDNTEIPGLSRSIAFINGWDISPEDLSKNIIENLKFK